MIDRLRRLGPQKLCALIMFGPLALFAVVFTVVVWASTRSLAPGLLPIGLTFALLLVGLLRMPELRLWPLLDDKWPLRRQLRGREPVRADDLDALSALHRQNRATLQAAPWLLAAGCVFAANTWLIALTRPGAWLPGEFQLVLPVMITVLLLGWIGQFGYLFSTTRRGERMLARLTGTNTTPTDT